MSTSAGSKPITQASGLGSTHPSKRTMWESYQILPKRAKLIIAGSIGVVGLVGLYASDRLEEAIPAKAPPSKDVPQAGYQTV
ncbi:unnamed protein product [Rhizoctonia solani]|uniref:Cytochrome c oxidase assembly factor 3 n=1 Tax=Rhizoctonia solani TaxID=456999 RepID=A0A8H2WPQ2_9AGAM|nr:uncharacterized protein RhiXN_09716 [Rhizoctonia solani]QRW22129.1 hypothetical protein RhiXN_09716 [Rhizoctonia solani]CAE6402681.1 unnamed protein product [Rhizoctonia solani]